MFSVFISVAGIKMLVDIVVGDNVIPEETTPSPNEYALWVDV